MWSRSLRVAAPLLGCAALAQEPPRGFDDGPLLCFTTNTLPADPCDVSLHVVPLRGDGKPIVVWSGRCAAREAQFSMTFSSMPVVDALARLDRDRLLLARHVAPAALVVVDVMTGTQRVLAVGGSKGFVAVHGDDVLHLGDPGEAARDNFLYATPWQAPGERRRVAPERFDRVPIVAGNVAIAIEPGEAAVRVVGVTNAKSRVLWQPPAGANKIQVALSPGGQRVAIGCVQPNGGGLLAVVDVATAAVVRCWPDLPIRLSTFSSFLPCLEVGWHDDDEVVCSESRCDPHGLAGDFVYVRRSVTTGAATGEHAYSKLKLQHDAPPPPASAGERPPPALHLETVFDETRLMRAGSATALATFVRGSIEWNDVAIAPDGRHAVARLGAAKTHFTVFTAAQDQGRVLVDAFAYDAVWLPAVSALRTSGR